MTADGTYRWSLVNTLPLGLCSASSPIHRDIFEMNHWSMNRMGLIDSSAAVGFTGCHSTVAKWGWARVARHWSSIDRRLNRMYLIQHPLVLLDPIPLLLNMGMVFDRSMNRMDLMAFRVCATNDCTRRPYRVEESDALREVMDLVAWMPSLTYLGRGFHICSFHPRI